MLLYSCNVVMYTANLLEGRRFSSLANISFVSVIDRMSCFVD